MTTCERIRDKCSGKTAYIWNVRQIMCYPMEVNDKRPYEAPAVEVLEVKTEGIICSSGGTEDYNKNSPLNW